jgi:hypothetical protein
MEASGFGKQCVEVAANWRKNRHVTHHGSEGLSPGFNNRLKRCPRRPIDNRTTCIHILSREQEEAR